MFGVSRDDNKVDNEETQDEPLIQNDTYDPLTNKLATMSRWGDYESGRNNNGVNGHLGHQRNGSEGVVIELGAG